jgi:hypothetical protein
MTTTPDRSRVVGDIPGPRQEIVEPRERAPEVPRVLTNLHHGGHVVADDVPRVDPGRRSEIGMRWAEVEETSTPFGYMFRDLQGLYPAAHLPLEPSAAVVASLKALGAAMVDQPNDPADANSTVPPIYTYWGQFVDHDLTANTDRDEDISITDLPLHPLQPEKVVRKLRNLREPRLNLDSVYGNGPDASGLPEQVPYEGEHKERLTIGPLAEGRPDKLTGDDLPREGQKALIGDGRNDENLVVAQLHLSFLKFHNAVIDWFAKNKGSEAAGDGSFTRARQLVEWHYQWVTVHDFLKRIADEDVVNGLLDGSIPPRLELDATSAPDKVFMPLEFSIAAYRFGHSMVRGAYDWNANFGAPGNRAPSATFELLFIFTGKAARPFFGAQTLPFNWPAQFERFTGAEARPAEPGPDGQPDPVPPRFARRIDTRIAPPLADLFNEGNNEVSGRIERLLKRLAVRNLLRGYRLAIPTGQAVARSLGIEPLTREELLSVPGVEGPAPSPVGDALIDGDFLETTPLWFYVLKEAEVLREGNRLGPVGSRIVAETIIGQLRADPTSFLNQGWDPRNGVTVGADGRQVDSIISFLQFADMHP